MLKLFLWLRYLRRRRIVLLSIAAVALSTALLIVVSSLFTGFIDAFEQAAVQAMGDVVVAPPVKFAAYPKLIGKLEELSDIEAATAVVSGQGLLYIGRGNVRAVMLLGIEPDKRARVTGFKSSLLEQAKSPSPPHFDVNSPAEKIGCFVGIGVVANPDENTDEYDMPKIRDMIGRNVVLTTGTASQQSPDGSAPQVKRKTLQLAIADVIFSGIYYLDKNFVYLPIEAVQKLLYQESSSPLADQIQIKLTPGVPPERALAEIRGVWEIFAREQLGWSHNLIRLTDIETSRQMQSKYVGEIVKQMGVLLLIFGVVSFGVVLLVFCIFYMIVRLKQKDIAIIKSCGAGNASVSLVFVGFGVCAGLVGSAAGTVLGAIITKNINTLEAWIRIAFGLKLWKSSVYMFSRIPNEVNWSWVLIIVVSAIVSVAVGSLVPALIAARTRPVKILRYE